MKTFQKGDLSSVFEATGVSYAQEITAEPLDRGWNDLNGDDQAAEILKRANEKAEELETKQKNFSFTEGGNEAAGLQKIAQDAAGINAARKKEEEKKKTNRAILLAQLMNAPELKSYQVAFNEFDKAVGDAQANQNKIDDWKDAILLAQHEQNFSDLKTMLDGAGHNTDGMSNEQMLEAGIKELVVTIKSQPRLIEVMKEKAEAAQEKLDALLEKHPELKDDPEFIEKFMEPHVKNMQTMQELIEAQNSNLDFLAARRELAQELDGKNVLLGEFKTGDLLNSDSSSPDIPITGKESDLDFLNDFGNEPTISSFASGVDKEPPIAENITQGFNAASQGITPEPDEPELETKISVKVDGFKPN